MTASLRPAPHERHEAADRHIGEMRELAMASSAVQAVLGPDGYAALLRFSDNYYVPNLQDDVFLRSSTMEAAGASPVIPLHADERYRLDPHFASFSPQQRDAIRSRHVTPELPEPGRYIARWEMSLYRRACQNDTEGGESLRDRNAAGITSVTMADWQHRPSGQDYIVTSQPVTCFSMAAASVGGLMMHEFAHHQQYTTSPVRRVDNAYDPGRRSLRDEREAYALETAAITARLEAAPTPRTQQYLAILVETLDIIDSLIADPGCKDPVGEMNRQIDARIARSARQNR